MTIVKDMDLASSRKKLYGMVKKISHGFCGNNDLDGVLKDLGKILDADMILVARDKVSASRTRPSHQGCPSLQQSSIIIRPHLLKDSCFETRECLFTFQRCFFKTPKKVCVRSLHEDNHGFSHLIIVSKLDLFNEEFIVLTETTAIFFNQLLRSLKPGPKNTVRQDKLQKAFKGFSYTQERVFKAIVESMGTEKEILIKIKGIAEACGVSTSTVSKTLKLLQSAGVFECFSLGSKGTLIKCPHGEE